MEPRALQRGGYDGARRRVPGWGTMETPAVARGLVAPWLQQVKRQRVICPSEEW